MNTDGITGIGFDARHPCPEHNIYLCATCTRKEGECDWGACENEATVTLDCFSADRLVERRPVCDQHREMMSRGYHDVKETA